MTCDLKWKNITSKLVRSVTDTSQAWTKMLDSLKKKDLDLSLGMIQHFLIREFNVPIVCSVKMKFHWTRNMAGQSLSDEDMRVITHPSLELNVHVTTKTVQACALLGMVLVGPAVRLIKGPRTMGALTDTAIKAGKIGALIGLPLGPAMTYARIRGAKVDDDGVYDRCYRLRYNRNQVRVDRLSYLGAVGGAAGALYVGSALSTGAVVGLVGGTLLGTIYNSTIGEKHV